MTDLELDALLACNMVRTFESEQAIHEALPILISEIRRLQKELDALRHENASLWADIERAWSSRPLVIRLR